MLDRVPHHLLPVLVHLLKEFAFFGHLSQNVLRGEYGLQIEPLGLDFQPLIKSVLEFDEPRLPFLRAENSQEGRNQYLEDHSTVELLYNPPTTGTTLQWNFSPIHPLLGPLYSGTSLQSTHYWDHSTVEPLSNPPTTGTTLQCNFSLFHPLLLGATVDLSLFQSYIVPLNILYVRTYVCTHLCTYLDPVCKRLDEWGPSHCLRLHYLIIQVSLNLIN